jgi:glycerol-3-phosphate dehydrogenase (NAD(P)+)
MMSVSVIGGGAWGTACAIHLARKGTRALLWLYEPELCEIIRRTGENSYYLSGARIPDAIECTSSLKQAVAASDNIILATPSFALRSTLRQAAPHLSGKKILILSKGLETETFLRMSQVAHQIVGEEAGVAVLSGPSFAREVANGVFTAVVIASRSKEVSGYFQEMLHNERLRVYTSEDVIGVELGGALKNVMAIGAGMIDGLSLGANTQAAYVTRALAEIRRLGKALGARDATFMGLSGLGDLVLTCTGPLSRNRQFGVDLAQGKKAMEIVGGQKAVVEGYYTVDAAYRLSKARAIEMPITEELYRIVYENKDIRASLEDITARVYKEEEA